METKAFKDLELSRLGMGNMRLPQKSNGKIDWEESQKIIDYAMAHGINYYDTAHVYNGGESESCLGHCVKKYPRDSFYLATKFHIGSRKDYEAVFAEQLERLQTDHIDFYLIHCLMDGNIDEYLNSGAIEFFQRMKAEGKIRYLGFSSHAGVDTLRRFADSHEWDFAQLQLNYYDWVAGTSEAEYRVLEERNIPVMVMEPVRGGRLAALTPETEKTLKEAHADWSIASWALRFVKSLPGVQVILSGMSSMEQIIDNVNTFSDGKGLTEEENKLLLKVCDEFRSQIHIPCTACRYCTDGCPMKINIPEYLKLLNRCKADGTWGAKESYDRIDSEGKATDCIGCGRCMSHCPQELKIPNYMAELAQLIG